MSEKARTIADFLGRSEAVMLVRVAEVRGSAPREPGAFMLVSAGGEHGTIGGGQLEFQMIAEARRLLRNGADRHELAIPLGPGIGQCCGGHVTVTFERLGGSNAVDLLERVRAAEAAQPPVLVFGAGHVGLALVRALAPLPYNTLLVDTRADWLERAGADVMTRLTPVPEAEVERAAPGAAFVAVTHDHALDFLVTGAALRRGDARYVGMIGSRTKRAQFRHWFLDNGGDASALAALVSPIGNSGVEDKRPEVIAALTAAEIIARMATQPSKWAVATGLDSAKDGR